MPPDFERSDGAVQVQEISVLAAEVSDRGEPSPEVEMSPSVRTRKSRSPSWLRWQLAVFKNQSRECLVPLLIPSSPASPDLT